MGFAFRMRRARESQSRDQGDSLFRVVGPRLWDEDLTPSDNREQAQALASLVPAITEAADRGWLDDETARARLFKLAGEKSRAEKRNHLQVGAKHLPTAVCDPARHCGQMLRPYTPTQPLSGSAAEVLPLIVLLREEEVPQEQRQHEPEEDHEPPQACELAAELRDQRQDEAERVGDGQAQDHVSAER